MRGSLWICTLSEVLILIQRQFMTVNAERIPPTMGYLAGEKISLPVKIFLGFLSLIALIAVATVFVRVIRRFRSSASTRRIGQVESMAFDNLSYGRTRDYPASDFQRGGMASPQLVQQPDAGFGDLHIEPGGHCQPLDNTEKEVIPLDSSNCNRETLHCHLPSSFPKYITKVEATFTNTGGELSAPLESDIRIIVPSGAIPAGINQSIFLGVFSEETILLRDIPEASDKTLISPVVECGPHDIGLSEPVEIIVPHCLCLSDAKMEWITVYRCGHFLSQGQLNWERIPIEAEKSSQTQAFFTVKKDAIHIKTKTFSLWAIFACGGPRRKRATVFSNRPDPKSDLIYIRFYVYSDNMDSKRRVELAENERFPDSKPAREKPFRMYKDSKVITVKLTDLEEGWNFDKTDNTQIYKYEKTRGSGFRSKDACDFAVKPEDSRDVNGFSCNVKFQQESDDEEHSFYLNPGFTPLKRQSIRHSSAEGNRTDTTFGASQYDGYADWVHYISSLGSEPVTEYHICQISADVGRDWRDLLRTLSMKEKVIENLGEDYKREKITEQCFQGLIQWQRSEPQLATIKALAIALLRVGCFDALQTLRKLQYMEHQ